MARKWKVVIGILVVAVAIGLVSFRSLWQRIQRLSQSQTVEEQARREVLAPPITTPTDVMVNAKLFWSAGQDTLAPVDTQLPLSADPLQRSKQVLHALIASPPSAAQRTLPADVEILGFYILPDGTAVADFSDALASETPSGILSEQMTIESVVKTLESNVPALRRLKILIHGQEVETLAGHLDLTGFFDLAPPVQNQKSSQSIPGATPPSAAATAAGNPLATPAPAPLSAPSSATSAPTTSGASPASPQTPPTGALSAPAAPAPPKSSSKQ
jgi:hypothetical protein